MRPYLVALLILGACNDKGGGDSGVDYVGPVLTHTAPAEVVAGAPLDLEVLAEDPEGVASVSVFHRVQGAADWSLEPMNPAEGGLFTVTLDGAAVAAPVFEYYFKGTDAAEVPAVSYLPARSTRDPFQVPVAVDGVPFPFVEDFERDDGAVELFEIDWANSSTNFRGYPWQLSDASAHGGSTSAFHPHGYAGTDTLKDWLISPAIDLSSVTEAQVSWYERGVGVEAAVHGLYVSTGSRDPADGAYVAVAEVLPAPREGEWGRSAVYDLSAWAGNPAVYLAWYFEGVDADDWYIDDVTVGPREADLSLSWALDPAVVDPGDSTTLNVTVTNAATDVDATDAVVAVSFPDGGLSVATSSVEVGALAAGAEVVVPFAATVAADTPDNSYVPVEITVQWGSSSFVLTDRILVGVASVAHIEFTVGAEGTVELSVGVGDPDSPTWEGTAWSGGTPEGLLTVDFDVTDQNAWLPAAAGDNRWYLKATSENAGVVSAFVLDHDGVEQSAVSLPAVAPGTTELVWVPEPPVLAASASTTPSELDPGSVGVTVNLTVSNLGAATAGPVTATLSSTDADVTITDPGPLSLLSRPLEAGEAVVVSGFAFDVAAAHVDSSAVTFDLTLTDGVETWTLPLSFAVPYPVLRVTFLDIDDDGRDAVLDGDEAAELTFEVTNVGDEATDGPVSGSLTVTTTGSATVSATTNVESFGTLSPGTTRDADGYVVTVSGGAPGDAIELTLLLTDGSRSYPVVTTLYLGEPPWQSIEPGEDAVGDALNGWDFDLLSGSYRAYNGELQIRFTSAAAFDPSTLFIEAWGISSGADWLYYRLVVQSGVADLQGYDSSAGFLPISVPGLSYPDPTTVQFDLVLSDMGLFVDSFQLGIGSGWCGPPEYFCDQYPDAWGYPYDAFTTANWFDLTW